MNRIAVVLLLLAVGWLLFAPTATDPDDEPGATAPGVGSGVGTAAGTGSPGGGSGSRGGPATGAGPGPGGSGDGAGRTGGAGGGDAPPGEPAAGGEAAALTPDEERALALCQDWAKARAALKQELTADGQLKLMLTSEQAQRDFAAGFDGVLPVTVEGNQLFKNQMIKARELGKKLQTEATRIVGEVGREPAGVRQAFWAVMPVRGLGDTQLSADGTRVFFTQSARSGWRSGVSIFEEETIPLDPTDMRPTDDVYRWDLRDGSIACLTAAGVPPTWRFGAPAVAADGGCLTLSLGIPESDRTMHYDIGILEPARRRCEPVLGSGPLQLPPPAAGAVAVAERYVGPGSLSGNGQRLAFVAGTYVNRFREEGYIIEQFYLVLHDRTTRQNRLLTSCPVDRLAWPAFSGDGRWLLVWTVPGAFASPPARPPDLGVSPSAGQAATVYRLALDGSAPPQPLTLPAGLDWPSRWERPHPPFALSADGRRAVLEVKSGGRSQVYGWDASTNETKLLSVNSTGQPASGDSDQARISADGNWIVFRSNARDLSGADGSGLWAIYRADTRTRQLRRLELGRPGQPLRCHLRAPAVSGDGALVACLAETDVVPGSVGAGLAARMRPDRADRLVVLEVATGRVLGLGGQR